MRESNATLMHHNGSPCTTKIHHYLYAMVMMKMKMLMMMMGSDDKVDYYVEATKIEEKKHNTRKQCCPI